MDRVYIISRYRAKTEHQVEFNKEVARLGIPGRVVSMTKQEVSAAMKVVR